MSAEWFGGRLRELREKAGLTQQQLADAAGCTQSELSRWERGEQGQSWKTVLALAAALGVSCEEFTQEPAPKRSPAEQTPQEPDPKAGKKGRRK